MDNSTHESVAVDGAAVEHKPDLLSPDLTMLILTWVTFAALVVILKKFAWKPIIDSLQKREDYIRESLEQADKVRAQLADAEGVKSKILDDARTEASKIIQDSRQTAGAVAAEIEANAKRHA